MMLFVSGLLIFLRISLLKELDEDLFRDLKKVENIIDINYRGCVKLLESLNVDSKYDIEDNILLEVWSPGGVLLFRSQELDSLGLGPPPDFREIQYNPELVSRKLNNGMHIRLITRVFNIDGKWLIVRLAHSEENLRFHFERFLRILLVGLPLSLLLMAISVHFLVRRFLKPLDEIAKQARRISAERLNERFSVKNPNDELGHLSIVLNEMLDRLEQAFNQLKRFTADASHELRTPLTALRSVGEVGLQDDKSVGEYREIIGSMLEEVDRMTHLVDNLLLLSRADSGEIQMKRESFSLYTLAEEVVELLEVLAQEKEQLLVLKGSEGVYVKGDRTILRQAIVNLVDNAIKYSPVGSEITIRVYQREDGMVILEVHDQGPGIPPEHQDKIFERFYRMDKARSRLLGGAGLGLAIVQWAVTVNQGTVQLETSGENGSIFRLLLPGQMS